MENQKMDLKFNSLPLYNHSYIHGKWHVLKMVLDRNLSVQSHHNVDRQRIQTNFSNIWNIGFSSGPNGNPFVVVVRTVIQNSAVLRSILRGSMWHQDLCLPRFYSIHSSHSLAYLIPSFHPSLWLLSKDMTADSLFHQLRTWQLPVLPFHLVIAY